MFYNNFYKLISRFPTIFKTIPTSYLDSLSYEDQLNWLCAIILELKDQIANIDIDISSDPTILEIQQNIQTLTQSVASNTEQINTINYQLDVLAEYIGETLEGITNRLSALETATEQTNQNVQSLQQGVANLGQQIHSLTNRVTALEEQYGVLESSSIIVNEVTVEPYN